MNYEELFKMDIKKLLEMNDATKVVIPGHAAKEFGLTRTTTVKAIRAKIAEAELKKPKKAEKKLENIEPTETMDQDGSDLTTL